MNQSNNPGKDVFASSGTNVSDVKRRNEQSGLSYNQVKEHLARKPIQK
ncbi:hypothetical protein [Halobacillus faecis]|uniref:Gamma-type small acid-soluble spore protein n=1 Tax=Halobacillus faecis TaxID=360184 RepID=A0A511WRB9_9BACI|nr:hypothetical protein [Halobacillus faecis]GEN53690.1 hypothetical protein HFA01_19520 [Halobacillus faecis]